VGAPAFVAALAAALPGCERHLLVQFSTFEGDSAGQELARMLTERARAGVEVRMLLDAYSDVIVNDIYPLALHRRREARRERAATRAVLDQLRAAGVAIKRTAPPGRFGRYLLYRDHKKMVVLDDRVAFVGGLNVSDHNYDWHDFMVRIEGPVVADLVADHTSTWEGTTLALDRARPDSDYVLNQCAGRPSIMQEVLGLVDGAKHRVMLESPYLLGAGIEAAILRAAQRGVKVTLVLPSRANHLHARVWVRSLLRRLHHENIDVHGYLGAGGMTHAKFMIVDDEIATFGSLNFLELEALAQKELNVFSRDAALIRALQTLVASDVVSGTRIARPLSGFGRFTYNLLYRFFRWYTDRLLRDPSWRARYC
jgi:cardiolipin synthase A/B